MAKRIGGTRGGSTRVGAARASAEAPITPLKIPRGVKTIVVFGGTFDPPHSFHGEAWWCGVLATGRETWTAYVPAARSPHKAHGPVASDQDRVAMLRIALAANHADGDYSGIAGVWSDEIDRAAWDRARGVERPSYTIDTLRRLRSIVPRRVRLRLLIGSDQALAFHLWRDYRDVMAIAEPIVALREPTGTPAAFLDALDPDVWTLRERLGWARRIVTWPPEPASSTAIRGGRPPVVRNVGEWARKKRLEPAVARYIVSRRLYGVRRAAGAS